MAERWNKTDGKEPITKEQLQKIQQIAKSIKYGSITLVFQDGVLVQIEQNQKIRVR